MRSCRCHRAERGVRRVESEQVAGSARTCRTRAQGRPQKAPTHLPWPQRFLDGHRFYEYRIMMHSVEVRTRKEKASVGREGSGPLRSNGAHAPLIPPLISCGSGMRIMNLAAAHDLSQLDRARICAENLK